MEFVHSDEEELQKDIKERDSFANRLKARDESKTRKIAMPSGSGAGKLQRKYLISLPLIITNTARKRELHILHYI